MFGDTGFANADADALTFRDENGQPVQDHDRQAAGRQHPVVAARRLQLERRLGAPDAGARRHRHLHRTSGLCLDLEPDWQHRRADRLRADVDNTVHAAVQPEPGHLQAHQRHRRAGVVRTNWPSPIRGFKFPQVWRSNIAVDRRLPWGITGTAEYIYNKDVNGVYYINANLPAAQASFAGADNSPAVDQQPHPLEQVHNAIVLKNQDVGDSWNLAFSGEQELPAAASSSRPTATAKSKNTVDPGSIAFGSWNSNQHAGDPNNPGHRLSPAGSPGHRFFLAGSYTKEYFSFGGTTFSAFFETRTESATPSTAIRVLRRPQRRRRHRERPALHPARRVGDELPDLHVQSGRTYTAAEQAAAWDALIAQDDYLKEHRGEYAQRGAMFLPFVKRLDFNVAQDLFATL